jgi:hypothetical protein
MSIDRPSGIEPQKQITKPTIEMNVISSNQVVKPPVISFPTQPTILTDLKTLNFSTVPMRSKITSPISPSLSEVSQMRSSNFSGGSVIVDQETGEEITLHPCHLCDRKFNAQALEKHKKVCMKVFQTKNKKFDTCKTVYFQLCYKLK